MPTDCEHALSALVKKRGEIASIVCDAQAKLRGFMAQLEGN